MKIEEIKIGDKVELIDMGCMYITYEEMARYLKATRWKQHEIGYLRDEVGITGRIVNFGKHLAFGDDTIYLVNIGTEEILIGYRGVKFIEEGNINNMRYREKMKAR